MVGSPLATAGLARGRYSPFVAGAAFFDLDRTLLAGASGPVYSDAMRESGFVGRTIPGEKLMYGVFNLIGETLPSMALARQGATFARGRPRDALREAGEAAAGTLAAMIQPFAWPLINEHREAGRRVVMATTTPYDLVRPLADWLGLDAVLATRYGVNADGTYDGTIVGPFVWASGKLAAVREWAAANEVDLAESYAYSDSVFDTPLLSAVAHPVAVNPDPSMLVMATLRRWPVRHFDVSPGVFKIPVVGVELQRVLQQFARPQLMPYVRFDVDGIDNIPSSGPGIIVMNHRSYFDAGAMSIAIARSGRTVRFLGKKEVFDVPVVGQLARAMGGIRVERASGSSEPLRAAVAAIEAGELVGLAPQGTIPRGPAFFDPVLKGRWGAARLQQLTGAPVIPVGLWGTEKVWPRSSRLPNVLNLTDPPTVRIRVGPPAKGLKGKSLKADTERIMRAIVRQLPPEARKQHTPTAEELAATYPPGYKGDPAAESDRRPGAD
jgi:putative phosphoserine phosphatase / 1-acylglycerol-3-phosphate O-acyltransferase